MAKNTITPFLPEFREIKFISEKTPYPADSPHIKQIIEDKEKETTGANADYRAISSFLAERCIASEQTFNAYRTELERFALWSWNIKNASFLSLDKSEISQYIDFCIEPPRSWVGTERVARFLSRSGIVSPNPNWRPFRVEPDKIAQRAKSVERGGSQATLKKQFSILNSFYGFLMEEELVRTNPIKKIKDHSGYITKGEVPTSAKVLSDVQWACVIEVLTAAASANPQFERNLFAVITLKTLYLRISEIACRNNSTPKMSDFKRDRIRPEHIWFSTIGKGNKARVVNVPDSYLPYLKRYRNSLGMSDFPEINDEKPLLPKIRGKGGLSIRQATRLIEDAFELVCDVIDGKVEIDGYSVDSSMLGSQITIEIKAASSHWLRHTGASMDIRTRPLRHLADDLGHAKIDTTDKAYIQSAMAERAESGRTRKV